MTLYVDVDDTLILWSKDIRDGSFVTKYEPNPAVVHFVRVWRQFHPDARVICWSLGGKEYAEKHAQDHLPGLVDECLAKFPILPIRGDIFIDDDPLPSYRSATIHPEMLERDR